MGQNVVFYGPFECAIDAVTAGLSRHGYHVVRSFDLQSARAHYENEECACPLHGTSDCTCQYVVLLAYHPTRGGHPASPCVLTAHGFEQTTQVALHSNGSALGGPCAGAFSALLEAVESPEPKQQPAANQPRWPACLRIAE
jgi:hypothetical protein